MLKAAASKDKKKGNPKKTQKGLRAAERSEEDTPGRLNVVWGYAVIKTSCLGSFKALLRAADTNSRGIKDKPQTFLLLPVFSVAGFITLLLPFLRKFPPPPSH